MKKKRKSDQIGRSRDDPLLAAPIRMLFVAIIMGITGARVPNLISQPTGLLTSNVTLIGSNSGFLIGRFFFCILKLLCADLRAQLWG